MFKILYFIPLIALVFTTGLFAQSIDNDKKYFSVRQECEPFEKMYQQVTQGWGEKPLFIGQGLQISQTGEPFTGGSMFFVNQDSGSWSLVTLYQDGTACMTSAGTNFQPYSE